jgi:hypothetical protein
MATADKPLPGRSPMMNAPNQINNVALQPTDPHCGCTPGNCSCGPDCGCMCCYGNGPGGRTTNVQYNEKGILETGLMHIVGMTQTADLGSDHDSYAQGIYNHAPTPNGLDD